MRCVKKRLQIRGRGSGVFGKSQTLEGEVWLIEEFKIWRRVIFKHVFGGLYVSMIHDDGNLGFIKGAVELRFLSGREIVIGLLVEGQEGEAD